MDLLREKLRAQGHHRAQVAAAMIGSAVVGGVISSSAAKSAANTQADAANRATDSQNAMFDKTVGLEQPFRQSGIDAQAKLNNLLGIGAPAGQVSAQAGPGAETEDQIRARLAPQFTTVGNGAIVPANDGTQNMIGLPGESTVNQQGLDAAVQAELARQPSAVIGGQLSPGANSDYGSLLKPFGAADFQEDPGIQFQTQQGNLALTNSNAAQNGALSGAALKSLIGYNQQMAGLGYQSAFDRYMSNKSFTLGSLMDQEKVGQAAASGAASTAPAFSAGIAGSIQGAGNAQAAGTIGSANAISGGLSGASNAYLLRNLISGGSSVSPSVLATANGSSDPIGSLNSQMGWTGG